MGNSFAIEDFGLGEYEAIREQQLDRVAQRVENQIPDTLLLGEHPSVLTLGRASKPENYAQAILPTLAIERGGDVTYHGPGQLVVYPIMLLTPERRDLHRYLRNLEEAIILTLADFQIEGFRLEGKTGVWLSNPNSTEKANLKIASIGVAVRRWVTYHGLSLNVNPDMSQFSQINPCGFSSDCMTSIARHCEQIPTMEDVKTVIIKHLNTILLA